MKDLFNLIVFTLGLKVYYMPLPFIEDFFPFLKNSTDQLSMPSFQAWLPLDPLRRLHLPRQMGEPASGHGGIRWPIAGFSGWAARVQSLPESTERQRHRGEGCSGCDAEAPEGACAKLGRWEASHHREPRPSREAPSDDGRAYL